MWFRVDNRLVHGQVIEAWLPYTGARHLIVANDELAAQAAWHQPALERTGELTELAAAVLTETWSMRVTGCWCRPGRTTTGCAGSG